MKKKNINDIKKDVLIKFNNEYEILDNEYINNKQPLNILHKKCNKIFQKDYVHFFNREQGCPYCNPRLNINTKSFSKYVSEITNGEYILISEYINNKTHVEILHKTCNNSYKVSPSNFKQGYRCPHCFSNKKKNINEIKKIIEKDNEYELISKTYINNKTKLKIKHKKCNIIFLMSFNDFQQGHRCPHCAILPHNSKGIIEIESYLIEKHYIFKKEFSFEDCKFKNKLRFDFAVFNNNNDIICLIEYNGKQHYQNTFNCKENFDLQILRDSTKIEYCKNNNIPLFIISYKEKNIKNYLDKCLTTIESK